MALAPGSNNRFPDFAKRIRERSEQLRHDGAEVYRDAIADESPVDTGRLRQSWRVLPQGDQTDLVISDVEYAWLVANGHHTAGGGWVPPNHYDKRAEARYLRWLATQRLL